MNLSALDAAILAAYVAALFGVGIWAARTPSRTAEDYFLAGRQIPWLVTAASFLATAISALTLIGGPAEGYSSDCRYLFGNVGDIAAAFFVAAVFLPYYQKTRVTSIYETIDRRFGRGARVAASGYFLISRTLASTVRVVAAAKVLEVASGGALSYPWAVTVTILLILAYSTAGGGKAIAWTDLLQFLLIAAAAVATIVFIAGRVPGGVPAILHAARHARTPDGSFYDKLNFLELLRPRNLGLFALIASWGFFNSAAAYGTDQDLVQRLLMCDDPRKARWGLILSVLASVPIALIFLLIGVAIYAFAQSHPDFAAGVGDPDRVFPRFILYAMPSGLKGLLLAALAAAAMGSSNSALAALATSFTVDFYKTWKGDGAAAQTLRVSRASFVGFGLGFLVLALLLPRWDDLLWLGFRMVSFTYGPLLGLFALAILTDWRVPSKSLVGLMLGSTAVSLTLAILAWKLSPGDGAGFWRALHADYWRLYVPAGAAVVFLGGRATRQGAGTPGTLPITPARRPGPGPGEPWR